MDIDVRQQISHGNGYPLPPVRVLTGSAAAFEVMGIPFTIAGRRVMSVVVAVTNADGAEIAAVADCNPATGSWCAVLAASCFTRYGEVQRGLRIIASLDCGSGESPLRTVIAVGRLSIVAGEADAEPGDPALTVAVKGGDTYIKSEVVEGVQHYKLQVIRYDAEMAAWGAEWIGDYILDGGEFVAVGSTEGGEE